MTLSRIFSRALPLAALLAATLLAIPAHARKPEEDKVPGFSRYATVQVSQAKWKPGTWKPFQTLTLDLVDGFKPAADARCQYGGLAGSQGDKATGFFHAAKIDGHWTLVDPDGHQFLSIGMDSTSMSPTARGQQALAKKYGDAAGWARGTFKDLQSMGFNTLGCWSDFPTFQAAGCPMPYTVRLNLMSGYGHQRGGTFAQPGHTGFTNDCIFVFDPEFEAYCQRETAKLAEYKNDPWLFGYFSDNELPFKTQNLEGYLKFPAGDPGRAAAEAFLKGRYGAADPGKITEKDREDFLKIEAERYFRIVSTAIKKADPNHIYLGSRFHGGVLRYELMYAAAGPYVDVCSVNYYGAWSPEYAKTRMWVRALGKPYIITEFYAKGVDSGMPNTGGAGWTVKTQRERGMFYQNFTLGLLADPGCVGWHYFKYIDNDAGDVKADPSNQDSNKGYLTGQYEPWPPVVEAMRQLNSTAYSLRDTLLRRGIFAHAAAQ